MPYKHLFSMKTILISAVVFAGLCSQVLIAQTTSELTETIAPKYSNEFLAIGVGADALGLAILLWLKHQELPLPIGILQD